MTKKITAFLTAILCTASMAAMPASAAVEYIFEIHEGENGSIAVTTQRNAAAGIYVETGSTVLTSDMLTSFEAVQSITEWETYASPKTMYSEIVTNITPDGNGYILKMGNMDAETMQTLGRRLMLELDCVEDVQIVEYEHIGTGGTIVFEYQAEFASPDTVVDISAIPELADFAYDGGTDRSFSLDYDYEECLSGLAEFPTFYTEISQIDTAYGKYEYMLEFGNAIQEKYSDLFASFTPTVIVPETNAIAEYSGASIWTSAGDPNSDGEVNASDAAEMLVSAAQIGTGADVAITSAADVNADGELNAADAAAVLSYAAAKGTGADVSWVDILRR